VDRVIWSRTGSASFEDTRSIDDQDVQTQANTSRVGHAPSPAVQRSLMHCSAGNQTLMAAFGRFLWETLPRPRRTAYHQRTRRPF